MKRNKKRKYDKGTLSDERNLNTAKQNRKTLFCLAGSCVFFVGLYFAAFHLRDTAYALFSMVVEAGLYLLLPALFLAYIIINRGVSNDVPEPEQLSDGLSGQEKAALIEEIKRRHKQARPLLYFLFPLVFIVGFDVVYTMFFT
ncbi:MAG: hypothetical protein HFE78_00325 [Clostridiales bacterium]|nr:hypothetical protein [Clostridiales bacterium]